MTRLISVDELSDPEVRRLVQVLARRAMNWESGSAVVDWAERALLAGWDSIPTAIIAGLDKPPNEFEMDRHITAALESLGLRVPSKSELVDLLALTVCGDILAGTVAPDIGCRELAKLCWSAGYPAFLMPFHTAEYALDLARDGIQDTVEAATERIFFEARHLLQTRPH